MEIETYIDHVDGTYHIVLWYRDMVKEHAIYQDLDSFDEALQLLTRRYPLAKLVRSIHVAEVVT